MWNAPLSPPQRQGIIRRVLRWKPTSHKQAWLLAAGTGLAVEVAGCVTDYFWPGHAPWRPVLGWSAYSVVILGASQSYKLRRSPRR